MGEHGALESVRTRGFLGLCVAGAGAGAAAAARGGGGWAVLPVMGLAGALLCCFVGGGLGVLAAMALRRGRERRAALGTEACLVLSAYGTFLGGLAGLVLGRDGAVHYWAMAGSAAGGALAGALGESVHFLTGMLVLMSLDEAGRGEALRRSAREMDRALLRPEEDGPAGTDSGDGGEAGEEEGGTDRS